MEGEFGAAYRKDVQDVNDGAVPRKDQGFESNISVQGSQVTYTDPTFTEPSDKLVAGLLRLGTGILEKRASADQKTNFKKGVAHAADLGVKAAAAEVKQRTSDEGIFTALFGRTSEEEGFRTGAISQAVDTNLLSIAQNMENLVQTQSTQQLAQHGQETLKALNEQYKHSPDLLPDIREQWTKGFNTLAQQHVKPRLAVERERRNQNLIQGTYLGSAILQKALESTDMNSIAEANGVMQKYLAQPEHMLPTEYSDNITEATSNLLELNDSSMYDYIRNNGDYWAKLDAEDRLHLELGKEKFDVKHNVRRANAMETFNRLVAKRDFKSAEQLAGVIANSWPKTTDVAELADTIFKEESKKMEEEEELEVGTKAFLSHAWQQGNFGKKDTAEYYKHATDRIAKDSILNDPKLSVLEKMSITPEQIKQRKFNQPELFVGLWKTRQVDDPELQARQSEFAFLVRKPDVTPNEAQRIKELSDHLSVYKEDDKDLYLRTFTNKDEAATATAYSNLIDAGWPMANIIAYTRENASKADVDMKSEFAEGDILSIQSGAFNSYVSTEGNKSYWTLGLTNRNPDNEFQLKTAIAEESESMYKFFKGDKRLAQSTITEMVKRNGLMVGNNFHPGLGKLQHSNPKYSLPDYIRGLNASPNFREALKQAKFPPFKDLVEDPNISYSKDISTGGLRISYGDGTSYRSITVPLPTRDAHMIDYKTLRAQGITPGQQREQQRVKETLNTGYRYLKD